MNDDELIQQLNELGQHDSGAPAHLAARVLAATTLATIPGRDPLQGLFDWLTEAVWRSATAVATPLVIGFVLGISDVTTYATNYATGQGLEDTQWYDGQELVYADVLEEYRYDEF